jgi:broad specificity phosphatase PhoE
MAGANVIMFIRHGEKPGDDGTPKGVNHHGEQDPHSLSVRGWTRAGAIAALFANPRPELAKPERIIATKSSNDYKSKREADTATPLARRLGISVDQHFDHSQAADVSTSIQSDPRPTLVVWHHGSMSELLGKFPVANPSDIPKAWPDDRFDAIWLLHWDAATQRYHFSEADQGLLEGDRGVA